MDKFDVVVIGAGPGGTDAAREVLKAGKSVAVVEAGLFGGVCLNCGCIPTKMLLGAAAPTFLLAAQKRMRIASGEVAVDFQALQSRIARFTKASSQTVAKSLAAAGAALIEGRGELLAPGRVAVRGKDGAVEIEGGDVILACGSSPASFPGLVPDHDCILDSTDLLQSKSVPRSLVIVGAGAIGVEFAQFFNAMGCRVTLVEAAPHIAPLEDADVALELKRALAKSGIECLEGVKAKSLKTVDGMAELELEDGSLVKADKAVVAVGRRPSTAGLGAETAGCVLDRRGFVQTNAFLEAAPHVYAVGDVNGRTLLAHAASHQGAYCARRLLGLEQGAYQPGPVPACYYGGMEIMRVGATAQALLKEGKAVEVSSVPLSMNPLAQAGAATAGFVKAVWCEGSLAGICAVGAGVSHLVTVAQLLMQADPAAEHLHRTMFAHPTLDEIVPMALRAERKPAA
ncbi:MAG: NAD(P)/FAD-dependent oxidoreductase [Desulfovibrio sp.]|nr:NAD(P)/FAD-dependent oxidoreductase [Desulfovibrio sp.]